MSNNNDVEFPKGLYFKKPNQGAPDFVKGRLAINVADLKEYLAGKDDDWLNVDLKISRDGKPYAQINDFKPDPDRAQNKSQPKSNSVDMSAPGDDEPDLPF